MAVHQARASSSMYTLPQPCQCRGGNSTLLPARGERQQGEGLGLCCCYRVHVAMVASDVCPVCVQTGKNGVVGLAMREPVDVCMQSFQQSPSRCIEPLPLIRAQHGAPALHAGHAPTVLHIAHAGMRHPPTASALLQQHPPVLVQVVPVSQRGQVWQQLLCVCVSCSMEPIRMYTAGAGCGQAGQARNPVSNRKP